MNTPKNINLGQRSRKVNTEEKLVEYIKSQLGAPLITVDVHDDQILQCIDDTFEKFSEWVWNAQQAQLFVINTQSGIQDYILDDRIKAITGVSFADNLQGYAGGSNGSIAGIPMGSIMPPMYMPAVTAEGSLSSLSGFRGNGLAGTGVAGGVAGGPNTSGNGSGNPLEAFWAALSNSQTAQNMMGSSISYDYNASNHILRIFDDVQGSVAIEAEMDYVPNPDFDGAYAHPFVKAYATALVKRVWGSQIGKYSSALVGGATINYDRIINEAQTEIDKLEDSVMMSSESLGIFSG